MSTEVRNTILYSYQRGGASLLDFLNAESDYRAVQRNYLTDRFLSAGSSAIKSGRGAGSDPMRVGYPPLEHFTILLRFLCALITTFWIYWLGAQV
jgi:hypothetical protein